MNKIRSLKVKIYCDGASLDDLRSMAGLDYIHGFTTNPTLMRKAQVKDYCGFIKQILPIVAGKPISFEVISDDFREMKQQAKRLSGFGSNIYVKIPVMNTRGDDSSELIAELSKDKIKVNVTAIMTLEQIKKVANKLDSDADIIFSIFSGRIADTGVDPVEFIKKAKILIKNKPNIKILWASPRELLNIFQAEQAGSDIITLLPDFIKKMHLIDYDLHEFSLDTIKMFYKDAQDSGLKL
ncbi:MAG: transaldolase [Candidatus Omnitrophica bacterium]|jgi:transaldolase|nr:transaldolase [Candidatus Omnitrophota bacterium]